MADDLLKRGIKLSHMAFLSSLSSTKQITASAMELGITQPAASRLISELESITNETLYLRQGRGIELTEAGSQLAFRCTRIINELGDAARDIDEARLGLSGRVKIGAVTGPAIALVLPAIKQLRMKNPAVSIDVEIAASDVLAKMLLAGELDFALCRPPTDQPAHFFEETSMKNEPVSFVCRAGHPFLNKSKVRYDDLLDQDWVLPPVGTILRMTVERRLREMDLPLPSRVLSTSSFLFTLAMIRNTNAVAPIAHAVAVEFSQQGAIGLFDPDINIEVENFSFLTRRNQILTPAARVAKKEVERAFTFDENSVLPSD